MSVLVNRSHRVPFDQPIWMGDPEGLRPLRRLWASNLSEGGMFVRCAEPLLPGEKVLVALEGQEAILPMAEAVVVWQRRSEEDEAPAGVGLQFTELRPFGDQVVSSVVRSAKPPPLASSEHPEPITPLLEIQARPAAREPAAPASRARATEAYSTELHLLGQPSITVRATEHDVKLDFTPRRVASVVQEGSRVTVSFRD